MTRTSRGKRYGAHEFAKRAGVTVRTLHHYDRLGLLRPSNRSRAGHRLYADKDLVRLEQILVLKLIGLRLSEIRGLLEREGRSALSDTLDRQQRVLAVKREQLDKTIRAIGEAKGALAGSRTPNWELFVQIIKEIAMQNEASWQAKYFSDDAKAKIESRKNLWSPELQERVTREWSELYRDVEAALHEDPGSEKGRALALRWNKLVTEFTGGDPEIQKGLNRMYADAPNWPAEQQRWLPRPEVQEFIGKALVAAGIRLTKRQQDGTGNLSKC